MMIKANGEYLDFNGDVETESQIKLFEEISTSNGDFSYEIDIQDNGFNRKILGIPLADTIKSIYQAVPSEIIDDTGQSIYAGKLQVNRIEGGFISSTFYAGNTEWFALLSNPMTSLPLYRYDVELSGTPVYDSMFVDEGIVFPLVDAGLLVRRSNQDVKIEDFVPFFYVKTLFSEIFNPLGIKLDGDFIDDPVYNKLIIASNGRSQEAIRDRSCYVKKTATQINFDNVTITFEDDSNFPYFDGALNNYTSSQNYTADIKMVVTAEVILEVSAVSGGTGTSIFNLNFDINGVAYRTNSYLVDTTGGTLTRSFSIPLESSDILTIRTDVTALNNLNILGGSLKITPTYLYKVFGVASVPKWTQGEFVSNILRLFNVLPSYDTITKTLTLDLFNNIKHKPYVDVSDQITIDTVDFSDFVSNYAKNNIFKYQESDNEDLKKYNISNFTNYGSGTIHTDNAFIENSKEVVESDFTTPITYINGVFDMSMERFNFVDVDELDSPDITSVTDASGIARFNITNADDIFVVGDLVKLETTIESYNGEWVVYSVTSTYIHVRGVSYDVNATGTATLLRAKFTTDDNVYLMVNVPNVDFADFSTIQGIRFDGASSIVITIGIAYFNMLNNGTNINRVLKQSLSFGASNNALNYQITLLDTYWPLFSKILSDPVMCIGSGNLKRVTFDNIKSFLRPVRIDTEQTTNLYYLNRNRGYKGSERKCELQLIKLP